MTIESRRPAPDVVPPPPPSAPPPIGGKHPVRLVSLSDVWAEVEKLVTSRAKHVRRELIIADATNEQIVTHLLEECVELQEALLLKRDRNQIIEEAGDALAILLHLMIAYYATEGQFAAATLDKLRNTFIVPVS